MDHQPSDPPPNFVIRLPDHLEGGVWANWARVSHSQYEFTLDFVRMDYNTITAEGIPGVLVQRVNMSPLFVTQLMQALESNMRRYEQRFGELVIQTLQDNVEEDDQES